MSGIKNRGAWGKPDLRTRIYFEHAKVVGADDTFWWTYLSLVPCTWAKSQNIPDALQTGVVHPDAAWLKYNGNEKKCWLDLRICQCWMWKNTRGLTEPCVMSVAVVTWLVLTISRSHLYDKYRVVITPLNHFLGWSFWDTVHPVLKPSVCRHSQIVSN